MGTRFVGVWLSCSFLMLACGALRAAEEPLEVPVVRPTVRDVLDHEDFTGRVEAQSRVDLRARVTGYLLKSSFREGEEVKEGDVLFEIDSRPYQAEMDRGQAAVRVAEAHLKLAEAELQRAKELLKKGVLGQEEFDKLTAARVEAEARLLAAKASLNLSRLNLDFTRVCSPIAGRIGRRLLDPGNLVKADETILATVVSRDPMYVYFDADERAFLRLRRLVQETKNKVEKMPIAVGLGGEKGHPHRGEVDFTDNQVNPETGTVRMRAVLANKDDLLMPGLFVRVRLPIGAPYKALLVPSEAVLSEDGAKIVYVVNDQSAIERRPVEVGAQHDGLRIVAKGLKPEDRVVVGRQQRLRPGMTVRPVEGGKPEAPPVPTKPAASARPMRGEPGPVVLVETEYPGASAAIVADTVAAPIEQQVRGVEQLLSLRLRCTGDGKYLLAVTFARGADPKMSQVLVQNRVTLAMPILPDVVKRTGATIRERMPGVRMFVRLISPGGTYDSIYLSNYARSQIKDELTRLPGVAEVSLVGQPEHVLRVWLDPERLAARNLSAAEVVRALEPRNVQARIGQTPEGKERLTAILVKPLGRPIDAETLADVVVKTDGAGLQVCLKDVARIELGASDPERWASLDGKPAVALAIHTRWDVRPRKLSAAVRERVAELRSRLPRDLDLAVTFDFTANLETPNRPETPAYLLLDPELPPSASPERVHKALQRCEALLRPIAGVQHTLTLSDNPLDLFGNGPCILVALDPAKTRERERREIARTIRTRLEEIKDMTLRVRDLSGLGRFPLCAYPIDFAVHGPEPVPMRDFAKKLAERLGGRRELADVAVNAASTPRPQLIVDVDRKQAADRGVSVEDIFNTLQVLLGSRHVNDFNRFDRTWRVQIPIKPNSGEWAKDIKRLQVRNAHGKMVPLAALATVRVIDGPQALDFLDSRPMIEITANPAADVSPEQVRTLCEKLADEVRQELRLTAEYGLSWLPETARAKKRGGD